MRAFAISLLIPLSLWIGLSPNLAAQDNGSAAAQEFRSGFWLETGKGDLQKALNAYLKAADAEGPKQVRARALLRAALVQHRMKKADDSERTLQRIFKEFEDQADVVREARAQQTEWLRIAQRKNQSDAYRQELMSPEIQAKVIELCSKLAGLSTKTSDSKALKSTERQILAYGRGAVPALSEMAQAGVTANNYTIAHRATTMIFQLGALPPLPAVFGNSGWGARSQAWRTIFNLDEKQRQMLLHAARKQGSNLGKAVSAAAQGPAAALTLLATDVGGVLATEAENVAHAMIEALHALPDDSIHSRLVLMSNDDHVPIRIRQTIESTVTEYGWRNATAADWLAWSKNRIRFDATKLAIQNAWRMLRKGDGAVLDNLITILAQIQPDVRTEVSETAGCGLQNNGVPLQVPWTPERVRRFFMTLPQEGADEIGNYFRHHRGTTRGRALLLGAVFSKPADLTASLSKQGLGLTELLGETDGDTDAMILEDKWSAAVAETFPTLWPKWNLRDRIAALAMIAQGGLIHGDRPFPKNLRQFLVKNAEADNAEIIKPALEKIAERWDSDGD